MLSYSPESLSSLQTSSQIIFEHKTVLFFDLDSKLNLISIHSILLCNTLLYENILCFHSHLFVVVKKHSCVLCICVGGSVVLGELQLSSSGDNVSEWTLAAA